MKKIFFGTFLFVSLAFATHAQVTEQVARQFCLNVWFPALRLGAPNTPDRIEAALNRLLPLYTEDVELIDPNNVDLFRKPILQGRAEVGNYYRGVFAAYPEWNFTILAIYPTATGFVLHYQGTNAPPVASFEGVDIVELEEGPQGLRIRKLTEFYDRLPFTKGK